MSATVYRHYNRAGKLLYVGSSMRVFVRTMEHMHGSSWWKQVTKITIDHYENMDDAKAAEVEAIGIEAPAHNKNNKRQLRDFPVAFPTPDWKQLIDELTQHGITPLETSTAAGMSKGQLHDLWTGRQKSVIYETGVKLVDLHRSVMRRKQRSKK